MFIVARWDDSLYSWMVCLGKEYFILFFCIFLHCLDTYYQMWILGWDVISAYHVSYLGSELSISLKEKKSDV